ncbi:Fusaric acid resistance protein family protein [Caballeronia temeraria]|uniref:Fusaric acid resistance protein family protein n=1 Tax=Caballeronia temeraria TaxID=1777137 RepID=A0A158CC32_9BURK|nr:FUSC family protein [Caballeronia temeraria]SAK79831.1 Fusaric acid resistance protein family protein [Caballeronia temeraria]
MPTDDPPRSAHSISDESAAAVGAFVHIVRDAFAALGRELIAIRPTPARALFATQAMLSVGLAVALAYAFHLSNIWWAAISGFAVMQSKFSACAQRGVHRVVGTIAGALIGAVAGPLIGDVPWLFVPLLGALVGMSVYRALVSDAGYAWVLGGVTALMVTFEAHRLVSAAATASFALLRVAEVVVGTVACVAVSALFHAGVQHYRKLRGAAPVPRAQAASTVDRVDGVNAQTVTVIPSDAARAVQALDAMHVARAGQIALAMRRRLAWEGAWSVMILAALAYAWNLPGFAQAMVTAVAVLILPASALGKPTSKPVAERMIQRFIGCLLAGALSLALLPLLGDNPFACMLALCAGVWIGCHVQTGTQGASYVGRQFGIAFIMVFVQDHHWSSDPMPALMRLEGILAGIVVLSAVMAAGALWTARRTPHAAMR